jgi:hypothetical protein
LLYFLFVFTFPSISVLPSVPLMAHSSTWHIRRFQFIECQTVIYSPLIHNKQPMASDVRRWTAMTWSYAVECLYTMEWGWTTHDLSGHKESPTGGRRDCAQGRGPPGRVVHVLQIVI